MNRLKTLILVFLLTIVGLLLSVWALCQRKTQGWDQFSADIHRAVDQSDSTDIPGGSVARFSDLLNERLRRSADSGHQGDHFDQSPNGLPNACLSGLPGLNLGGTASKRIQAEVDQVRQLIEQEVLQSQSAPGYDAMASFLPSPSTAGSSRTSPKNESAKSPADITMAPGIHREYTESGIPVTIDDANSWNVRSVDYQSFNPHERVTESATDVSRNPNAIESTDVNYLDPHADLFQETLFPSASQCAKCHEQIFDEWSSSSHAYSAISPMYQKFEQKINTLTQGTIGYFCMRCHAPVATAVGLRRDQPIWDGPKVFREGVTCIVCHRVKENYTKANGERRIEPGDNYAPVFSGSGSLGSQVVSKYADFFKVKTSAQDRRLGIPIHRRAIKFEQLSQSDFCMSCHQVTVQPGIKLEVVWDQYRASPARREGTQCQECHMGIVPGVAEGYSIGPAAVVNGKIVNAERKHSNHSFYGPGYSIAHPGIFPHNKKADRWSINDWLSFDWRAGWGTDDFEDAIVDGRVNPWFPTEWETPDDRFDGREIIEENLAKLGYKKDLRRQVLENGSRIDGPFFQREPTSGDALRFHYCVRNTNRGHNMPSGSLGAQPQLWLNVALIGPNGDRIWETGYLDSEGDLADQHSADVLERRIPMDKQLFNLQTKFLITNVKGTDREAYLPVNFDIDQLPFIRPAPQPVSVLNHPPSIRMESHSIPPLGMRKAKYVIPAQLMCEPGTYRLSVRLRSRAEPIYFMKFVGATPEMIRMMNEWIVDGHVQSVVFEVR